MPPFPQLAERPRQPTASAKRLPFVVRRVRLLQELRDRGVVNVLKVSGIANPADALTKHLKVKETFRTYMARLYQCSTTEHN